MSARFWMRSFTVVAALLISLAVGSTAFAISIDFADGTWSGAQGQSSFSQNGITLLATNGLITVNAGDGLGITDDEIGNNGSETLRISFASAVTLQTVLLTDLFPDEGLFGYDEHGAYSINGLAFTTFQSNNSNGDRLLNINQSAVNYITFKSASDLFVSDFSVRSLTYSTPEPSSLLLVGCIMVFLALSMKRLSRQP